VLSGIRRSRVRARLQARGAAASYIYSRPVRRGSAIRAIAWGMVAAGVAAPLVRKRVKGPPVLMQTLAFAAPLGLSIAVRRSRGRDIAVCCLQMWAYLAAYKSPHDDEARQAARVHIDYPIDIDRVVGFGELPTLRLQRALAQVRSDGEPRWRLLDSVLVWTHWTWFMVPHASLVYILIRHPDRFSRAAVMTYAVFDLGASVYWLAPTAPPWYAAIEGHGTADGVAASSRRTAVEPEVRRMMVEYGEHFWRDGWGPLYSVFGGNPLAAMPSLHFATSLMAALLLAEVGPVAGALGGAYTLTLGFALVYLGEHYVIDLLAGAALTAAVRGLSSRAAPAVSRTGRAVAALEAMAQGAS
jgi:membrane-associated phospholipid phosphatase